MKLLSKIRNKGLSLVNRYLNNRKTMIMHRLNGKEIKFSFYTPNPLSLYRAVTFSTKEPETLEWIDKYAPVGGIFFDIGANVGLYSLYHAKTKGGIAYAFEPSVFNIKLLAKNAHLNKCSDSIRIITNPLTEENEFARFNLQSTEESGALSSFGVDYGHDGKKLAVNFSYTTLGFSLDFLIREKIIATIPSLIKIDVDGTEHLILRGAIQTISDNACRSILIEVNDSFIEMASEVERILIQAGFVLADKRSSVLADADNFTCNQIWIKP
jgi:FkbM family methyltransferase